MNRKIDQIFGSRVVLMTVLGLSIAGPTLGISISDAQERQRIPPARPIAQTPTENDLTPALVEPREDYQIGPEDVIDIQVDRAPELTRTFRVSSNGTIAMPFIGRMTVAGKTQEGLSVQIADALRGRYLVNPSVIVVVKQINSHTFFIQGAVRRPGVFQIEGKPSLLKVVTLAGGLAENHSNFALIIREKQRPRLASREIVGRERDARDGAPSARVAESKDPQSISSDPRADLESDEERYELIPVNIAGLFQGRFDQNVYLKPGDIVNIPAADVFYVGGEVYAPGSYPLKDGTTLRQAISMAQGTNFKAATSRGVIFRDDQVTGKREEIRVDIGGVMSGRKEDLIIKANDIIIVPNSKFKSVSSGLLSALGVNAARLPIRY